MTARSGISRRPVVRVVARSGRCLHHLSLRPLPVLLRLNFPLALAVDIPKTYDLNAAIDAVENIIQAYQVHLAGVRGEDSRSVQRVTDCRRAFSEINNGDALHLVQIAVAVAADDLDTLKERVQAVINETRAWFSLRQEVGELLTYQGNGLEAAMRQAEGIAMGNGELDANRADGRLFTDGPPDRFLTLREAELLGQEAQPIAVETRDISTHETQELPAIPTYESGSWEKMDYRGFVVREMGDWHVHTLDAGRETELTGDVSAPEIDL